MSDVTPNDMPGADNSDAGGNDLPDANALAEASLAAATAEEPGKGLSPDKLAELNRKLRDERKAAEREAREAKQKAAEADARWQQLAELFGGKGKSDEFDPKAALDELRGELMSERTARLRSDVARETGVDPEDIHGSTEEEMRASAERFQAKLQARIEEALKSRTPAAPPASTVTANDKIAGPEQITSREELAKLPPAERMKAMREGRLNHLMGKST
jgi:hypothetical protein